MKIFITGGCGFIGSHVADLCIEMKHEICVIDDLSTGREENASFPFYEIGIEDRAWIIHRFETWKPDAIIHLAAQPSLQESIKNPIKDVQINLLGTINLVRLALKYHVPRIVFASTSAVYAPRISGVYPEDSPAGPLTPYGISKWGAEQYIKNSGLSYVILRLGNVYGPRQIPLGENQLIPRALNHIYQGKPFLINGDGKQKRDFVYIDDITNAFVLSAISNMNGTFNISSGLSYSVNEVLEIINWATQRETIFKHGPEINEPDYIQLVVTKAYYQLGWEAKITLRKGIDRTVEAWSK